MEVFDTEFIDNEAFELKFFHNERLGLISVNTEAGFGSKQKLRSLVQILYSGIYLKCGVGIHFLINYSDVEVVAS